MDLQKLIDRIAIIEIPTLNKAVTAALAGMFAFNSINLPANALTKEETLSLSYEQVKGSGLANRCPEVFGEQTINLASGKKYKITDLCLEPTNFQVKSSCVFTYSTPLTSVCHNL
jgi:hypothetical protein